MFKLRTLGGVELRNADEQVVLSVTAQPRRLALLIYLASQTGRGPMTRDRLLALFWPEWSEDRARNALNQALHFLRRSLASAVVESRGSEVGLAQGRLVIDAQEFERTLDEGRLSDAAALYAGDFLDGFRIEDSVAFDHWADGERERLRQRYSRALEELATRATSLNAHTDAAGWYARLVSSDPLSKSAVTGLALSQAAAGRHGDAARALRAYVGRLANELELEPAADVVQLLEELESKSSPGIMPLPRPDAVMPENTVGPPWQRTVSGRRRVTARYPRAAALALVLVLMAIPAFILGRRDAGDGHPAILVLPYRNQTGEATHGELSRVAADWIAHGLGRAALGEIILHPVAESESDPAATAADPRVLAREAGAAYYVHGSVTRLGDSLYIHTTIAGTGGRVVQRLVTAGAMPEDLLRAAREQTVGALAAALDARVAPMLDAGIQPPQYGAYLAYVEGLEKIRRGDIAGAAEELKGATELDTTFVQALFMLATIGAADESQLDRVRARAERLTPYERVELERVTARARLDLPAELAAARRLVALAPRTPDARMSHADAALRAGYFREARSAVRALERRPGRLHTVEAYNYLAGEVHHAVGDYAGELRIARLAPQRLGESSSLNCLSGVQALAALGRAAALDSAVVACAAVRQPGDPLMLRPFIMAAREARAHGHPELAERIARRGIDWFETGLHHSDGIAGVRPSGPLANIHAEAGDTDREYEIIRSLFPPAELAVAAPEARCRYAIAAARAGDARTADRLAAELDSLLHASEERGGPPVHHLVCRASLAAALNHRGKAVRLLAQAVSKGMPAHTFHRGVAFHSLIGYPPFDALIRSRD
ncbi:hypothetical protein BH23GEM9_BH23GEM9_15740 [soil metagenome]